MDVQSKRKLKEVIRGLVGDGFTGTQSDLAKALKSRGFDVTQSTVSRTMKQMGVLKQIVEGKQSYKLITDQNVTYRGSLNDLVVDVASNETQIVIKTRPGSAMFVAGFIDHECRAIVLGTIAGDDTIFVAPAKIAKIAMITKQILSVLRAA